ncbi:MAG TPA: hypothetical protein PKG54_10505 [Phycisphaerae bacterium]|nr:hypothetical protein [Phycisphaerae bacterium]HOB74945.1 hypothetical protein [Phycisphaerae bacterium]HPU32643.1 hypothetical protein [Phycisphaerae bacterium]HQA43142.1 hypothetical protein [Phycisphaerae bacterium]
MAIRWRKRVLAYRPQLYWLGIGALVAGTVLMCVGGYWMARSPEFLAAYRIRKVDAVYYGQRIGSQEQAYYQQEVARLQHGATLALTGFALFMGGVVVARYVQKMPVLVRREKVLPSFYEGVVNRKPERLRGD